MGKHFRVITDRSAFQHLPNLKKPTKRLNRWSLLLQEYEFTVQYRRGRLNQDTGSLSRSPYEKPTKNEDDCEILVCNLQIEIPDENLLIAKQRKDKHCAAAGQLLQNKVSYVNASRRTQRDADRFRMINDLLYLKLTRKGKAKFLM